jgi:tetratricopeptide (TPR) repeat protein
VAYAVRASVLYNLKEFRQAIRDYDEALTRSDPIKRETLYNDRGLAKQYLGDYQGAIQDFSQVIAMGCQDEVCHAFEYRADAYIGAHEYGRAIDDISVTIKRTLAYAVFLMNIDQFRRIYPEYDSAGDAILTEKLRALFLPTMSYEAFSKQFLIEAKGPPSFVLSDLYLKRGDAYAKLGQKAAAEAEYDRVTRAFPDIARSDFVEVKGKRVRAPKD